LSEPHRVEFCIPYIQQHGSGIMYVFMYVPFAYNSKGKFVPLHIIKAY